MSDFFENKDELLNSQTDNFESTVEAEEEESTIFSAPAEHKVKAPRQKGKSRVVSVIAACVAVALLVCGTFAVKKFIPEMETENTPSSVFEDIAVVDADSSAFSSVTITNKNGEFKFTTKEIKTEGEDGKEELTTYWTVDGIDISKLSNTGMEGIVSAAANVTALREITTKTAEECGFDKPQIKVAVTSKAIEPYTLLVGDKSPDGMGSYLKLDGSDKIYIAPESSFSSFDFTPLDLADKTSIPVTTFSGDTADNKGEDGSYAYFDCIKLSGKLFPEEITVINNPDDSDSAKLVPYLIETPIRRYANHENLTSIVGLFSNETAINGTYAFDINEKTLKEFGLDNPDASLTLVIDGESKSFSISKVDDEYCAVVYDGATMIRKVPVNSFAFLSFKPEDLYYKNMFMYSINDITSFELSDSEGDVKFDISFEEDENDNKTYHIKCGDKEITTSYFQSFYSDFVGTQCSDFTIDDISAKESAKITFTFYDKSKTVIKFYKANETQYQYSINDIDMGKITSSAYTNMIRAIRLIAENNEPI